MCKLIIKDLCKQRGMTQAELARKIGRSPVSLSQALSRNSLSLTNLQKIANVLGVDVPDLFERDTTTITCPFCKKVITIKTENNGLQKEKRNIMQQHLK